MTKDLSQKAKEIIDTIEYVTVASVTKDGMPWNSPVFSVHDDDYNFYWGTHKDSQKAHNIQANKNVFLVIYDSTAQSDTGWGVYMQATAHQITDPEEVKRVYDLLYGGHSQPFWDFAAVSDEGPIRLYKAVPQKAWVNDGGEKDGHYIDTRTPVDL